MVISCSIAIHTCQMMRSGHGGEVKALLLLDGRSIVSGEAIKLTIPRTNLAPKRQAHRYRAGREVTGNEQGNRAFNVAADNCLMVDEWKMAGDPLLLQSVAGKYLNRLCRRCRLQG